VLDDDVAILIRLVFPELNVSPLYGNEFAAAKARAWYTRAAEQGSLEAKQRLQQSALR